jgi:hypothetical protein
VTDATIREPVPVILRVIQADHEAHVHAPEDLGAILGLEDGKAMSIGGRRGGSGEGQELARHNPVRVAAVGLGQVLVGSDVEAPPIEPSKLDSSLQALQAVQDCKVEGGRPRGRVSERHEGQTDVAERPQRCFRGLAEHNHLVCANEACRIGTFLGLLGAAMHKVLAQEGCASLHLLEHVAVPKDSAQA